MDWNLFWSAFGAIGTTLGSLITACAVVIAVKQYRQPLKKNIEIKMDVAGTQDDTDKILMYHCVNIKNKGIRAVRITSLSILVERKKKLMINGIMAKEDRASMPITINPEECEDFWFAAEDFELLLTKAVEYNCLEKRRRLVICATDSLDGRYLYKTKIRVSDLIK